MNMEHMIIRTFGKTALFSQMDEINSAPVVGGLQAMIMQHYESANISIALEETCHLFSWTKDGVRAIYVK